MCFSEKGLPKRAVVALFSVIAIVKILMTNYILLDCSNKKNAGLKEISRAQMISLTLELESDNVNANLIWS